METIQSNSNAIKDTDVNKDASLKTQEDQATVDNVFISKPLVSDVTIPLVETKPLAPIRIVSEEEIRAVGKETSNTINTITSKILAVQATGESDVMGEQLNQLITEAQKLNPKDLAKNQSVLAQVFAFAGLYKFFQDRKDKKKGMFDKFNNVANRVDTLVKEIREKSDSQKDRVQDIQLLAEANTEYYHQLENEIDTLEGLKDLVQQEVDAFPEPKTAFEANQLASVQNKLLMVEKEISDKEGLKLLSMQTLPNLADQRKFAESLVSTFNEIQDKMIPAYKMIFAQYVITLDQKGAADLANKSKQIFREAIRQNADLMGTNAAEIAKARMSNMVDIETLEYSQEKLLSRIKIVQDTEQESLKAMREAKPKLQALEQALVKKYNGESNAPNKRISQDKQA